MNLEAYKLFQEKQNLNQIAIDFDGVIHKNSKGFHDGSVYDVPVKGSLDAIKWFYSLGFEIIIFSAKAKPDRPLLNGKTGKDLIQDWLKKYKINKFVKEVTSEKPRALVIIDDRCIRFENWEKTINFFRLNYTN